MSVHTREFEGEEPDGQAVPLVRPDVSSVTLRDGTALYDERAQALVMLNASASAVFERCGGSSTVDEIVRDIAGRHVAEESEVRDDVWRTLHKLAEMGLVTDVCSRARETVQAALTRQ